MLASFLGSYYDIYVEDSGKPVRDTFLLDKTVYIMSTAPSILYEFCGKPANRKITEYYLNGNKKFEGTFKNGRPTDTLKQWYRGGRIKCVMFEHTQKQKMGIAKNNLYPAISGVH